ncbi:MAG: hypothetical protein IJT97_07555, partial [Bacteroidaceae bacterium]|nr:hypothetical protein [Bacteroidaceae bacterium]
MTGIVVVIVEIALTEDRIRAAPLTAIFEYNIHNDIFDRFAIADADTVRSLLDIAETTSEQIIEIDEDNTTLLDQNIDFDFDSLFEDVSDSEVLETQDSYDFTEAFEETQLLPEVQ